MWSLHIYMYVMLSNNNIVDIYVLSSFKRVYQYIYIHTANIINNIIIYFM